jgi:Holliday junction resolvasome RuvABC DNA-binding subunit
MIAGEPGRLEFWNGDGRPWASAPSAPTPAADTSSAIRSALRKLGFTADEAAAAAAIALGQVGADATIEQQLTAALRACRPRGTAVDGVHGPRR